MTSALMGRGGVPSKADIVSNLSKGGCLNLQTGGVKKSEIFADVLNGSPLMQSLSYPTETVLSYNIARNRKVLSFKDSPEKN